MHAHQTRPITRRDRDMARGRRAAEAARRAGMSAMDVALIQIGESFNGSGRHSGFKDGCSEWIARGAAHIATRARFGGLARALIAARRDLDGALSVLDRAYAEQRDTMRRHDWWDARPVHQRPIPDHQPITLAEARLILRWLRRTHRQALFPLILDAAAELTKLGPRTVMITESRA